MLSRLVQATIVAVRHGAQRLGQSGRNLLRPARTLAALAGAASLDAVRPRSVLVAENALLRQQILLLRRAAPRPRLYREDRLILVLLARLNTAWRDTSTEAGRTKASGSGSRTSGHSLAMAILTGASWPSRCWAGSTTTTEGRRSRAATL